MTFGDMIFYGGIVLAAGALAALIIGNIVFASRKKKLKDRLMDKYGF